MDAKYTALCIICQHRRHYERHVAGISTCHGHVHIIDIMINIHVYGPHIDNRVFSVAASQAWNRLPTYRMQATAIDGVIRTTRKPSCRWQNRATRKHAKITPIRHAYISLSLTILVYLHLFSCCCGRNLRNPAKFSENSNLWSSRSSKVIDLRANRKHIYTFYPRDAMLARVIVIATCLSVRLSVCLSRAGIVSKRRKLSAWFLHHLVAPRL